MPRGNGGERAPEGVLALGLGHLDRRKRDALGVEGEQKTPAREGLLALERRRRVPPLRAGLLGKQALGDEAGEHRAAQAHVVALAALEQQVEVAAPKRVPVDAFAVDDRERRVGRTRRGLRACLPGTGGANHNEQQHEATHRDQARAEVGVAAKDVGAAARGSLVARTTSCGVNSWHTGGSAGASSRSSRRSAAA